MFYKGNYGYYETKLTLANRCMHGMMTATQLVVFPYFACMVQKTREVQRHAMLQDLVDMKLLSG